MIDSRTLGRWALTAAATLTMLYILTPLISVTWLSFYEQEIPSFPPEGYSLKWYASIAGNARFVDGLLLSVQLGVSATAIGLAVGVPAALCLSRFRFPGRETLNNMLLLPLMVPGVVLGTALYVFHVEAEIATEGRFQILGSTLGLLSGHVLVVIPWVVRLVLASLAGFDRTLEEAAQNLAGRGGRRDVRLRGVLREPGDEPVPGRPRPHDPADRHPAVPGMEDRPVDRGGVGHADRPDRHGDADHRSFRQDKPSGVRKRWPAWN